jgi:hypothetical protein
MPNIQLTKQVLEHDAIHFRNPVQDPNRVRSEAVKFY